MAKPLLLQSHPDFHVIRSRFAAKYAVAQNGCWLWTDGTNRRGYGRMCIPRPARAELAHRISYALHKGDLANGEVVMHSCDTPACVNPDHLSAGTQAENLQDMVSKGRWGGDRNQPKGPDHHNAKLTLEQVQDILSCRESGRKCAARHGVHLTTVQRIRKRETWAHVSAPQ